MTKANPRLKGHLPRRNELAVAVAYAEGSSPDSGLHFGSVFEFLSPKP